MDRPTVYTQEQAAPRRFYTRKEAADRMGVTVRTVEQWHADGRLEPVPDSRRLLGHWVYTGAALVAAERSAKRGRPLRAQSRARKRKHLHYPS